MIRNKKKPMIHLHIGTHKTGTTSLQKFLYTNIEKLKKGDVLYPKTGWYHFSQHLLAFHLKGTTPYGVNDISKDIWEELKTEISTSNLNNIVISSEIFATLDMKQIYALYKKLLDYDVKIYLYLKRQDELFESMYNQQVKEWRNVRKETVQYFMNKKMKIYKKFNYFQLVNDWAMVFGKDNIYIRPMNKKFVLNTIIDFMHLIGFNEALQKSFKNIENENNSVSAKALEIIRLSKFVEDDPVVRKKIFHLATQFFPSTENNKTCLNTKQKIEITEQFSKSNKKLIKHYFDEGKEYLLDFPLDNHKNEKLSHLDLLKIIVNLIN